MPGTTGAVYVRGLPELQRAFKSISKDLSKEMRAELKKVAEPVRVEAENLLRSPPEVGLANIGEHWSRMRLGVTAREVYIAPASRRRSGGSPRPRLAPSLMKRMEKALDMHQHEIEPALERMIDRLAGRNGF